MGVDTAQYILSELKDNYDDLRWWRRRLLYRINGPVQRRIYPGDRNPIHVMEEDWDTLIVLDACRADLFEEVVDMEMFDSYQRVTSLGSGTPEWTKRNFTSQEFGDTVYIAANPYISKLASDSFHQLIEVWRETFDENEGTVRPEPVADAAREAHEMYPEKRIIVHFMQPHHPFIGSEDVRMGSWGIPGYVDGGSPDDQYDSVWDALEDGTIEKETVWQAYQENLRLVMEFAVELVEEVSGRRVITSDHGNMLGGYTWPVPIRMYSHRPGLRQRKLVQVPWGVIESETRRTISDEGVTPAAKDESNTIEHRLRELGYLE